MNPMEDWNRQDEGEAEGLGLPPSEVSARAIHESNAATLLGLDADDAIIGAPRRTIPQSAIVMGFVVALAAGSLYLMRRAGDVEAPQTMIEQELLIEEALAQLQRAAGHTDATPAQALSVAFDEADDVVRLFLDDPTSRQVPLKHVAKNPFRYAHLANDPDDSPIDGAMQVSMAQKIRQQEKQQKQMILRDELGRMNLQTVMTGTAPMAMISDQVVREGDRMGSFMIASIKPRAVELVAEGNTYTLWMNEVN